MGKFNLGEFEEIILLTVAALHGDAYGVAIKEYIETELKRKVSVGAMRTALNRLEKKGFLASEFGEVTKIRGGKRKRYFTVTQMGKKALHNSMEARVKLWKAIPGMDFDFNIQMN